MLNSAEEECYHDQDHEGRISPRDAGEPSCGSSTLRSPGREVQAEKPVRATSGEADVELKAVEANGGESVPFCGGYLERGLRYTSKMVLLWL